MDRINIILKIVVICAICAPALMSGCLEQDSEEERRDDHVLVAETPKMQVVTATPRYIPTVAPTPKYTEIWCMVSASFYVYDEYGNFLGAESFSDEITMPYTEYDWTDDSTTIEDVIDGMGFPYNYVETVSERASYPATDKYIMQGKYVIHCDGGLVTMSMTCTATRY